MIVKSTDINKRLASPMNLINRLKSPDNSQRSGAMSLFGIGRKTVDIQVDNDKKVEEVKISFNPFLTPAVSIPNKQLEKQEHLDDILENHDAQIKLGLAHDKALDLLTRSVDLLSIKLDDVRADKLPSTITAASKVVESIRRERAESAKNGKDRDVHFHFYTPQQNKISDYEVIDVTA